MVRETIIPVTVKAEITNLILGQKGLLTTLLDSVCTRYLLSLVMVENLGICPRNLTYSQLDGTTAGGGVPTILIEPLVL